MAGVSVLTLLSILVWSTLQHKLTEEELVVYEQSISRLIYKPRKAIIIFEKSYEYEVTSFSKQLGENQWMVLYKDIAVSDFLGPRMKWLLQNATLENYREELHFKLFCGKECIVNVMKQVTELDKAIGQHSLLRHFSTWFIISYDQPSPLYTSLDNVAWVIVDKPTAMCSTGHANKMIRMDCEGEIKLRYLPEVYTLLWKERGREWTLVDHTHLSDAAKLFDTVFSNTGRGLNGRQLLLSALEWPPQTIRQNVSGKIGYAGVGTDIMDSLALVFNFSYEFVEPPDKLWGEQTDNGSWTGVLGMVHRGEADLCPVTYGITHGRKKGVDFSVPLLSSTSAAIYKRRDNDSISWLYLLSCFHWQVYLLGFVAILWTIFWFNFLLKWTQTRELGLLTSWYEIGIGVPLRQGILPISKRNSVKTFVTSWCLFCLVMTAVYTGNLMSVLAVEKQDIPFRTIQELAEQNEYEVGCIEGTLIAHILKTSEDPVYKTLYRKLKIIKTMKGESYSLHDLLAPIIARLLEEKFVLIGSEDITRYIRSKTCDVVTMKERFFPEYGGFPFTPNSPIKKVFDLQLRTLQESGLIDLWFSNWSSKSLNCAKLSHVHQLIIEDLKTAIITCACCTVLSTWVLWVEIWWKGTKL